MSGAEKKTGALQKRGTAAACAVLMVLVSFFGIGGLKLKGLVSKTEEAFFEGDNSIQVNIGMRREYAANLLTLSEKLSGTDAAKQTALKEALEQLEQAERPLALSQADRAVEDAFFELGESLSAQAEQEGKTDMLHRQTADFESAGTRIARSAEVYNEEVERINRQLHGFPAGLLRLIWGIGEAEPCV